MRKIEFVQHKLANGFPVIELIFYGVTDTQLALDMEAKILSFTDRGVNYFIMNFTHVKYVGSTGIGLLVKIVDKFSEQGKIRFVSVPEKVIVSFDMLGLMGIFNVVDTTADALQSFCE